MWLLVCAFLNCKLIKPLFRFLSWMLICFGCFFTAFLSVYLSTRRTAKPQYSVYCCCYQPSSWNTLLATCFLAFLPFFRKHLKTIKFHHCFVLPVSGDFTWKWHQHHINLWLKLHLQLLLKAEFVSAYFCFFEYQ